MVECMRRVGQIPARSSSQRWVAAHYVTRAEELVLSADMRLGRYAVAVPLPVKRRTSSSTRLGAHGLARKLTHPAARAF